jgi:hypothetical protein
MIFWLTLLLLFSSAFTSDPHRPFKNDIRKYYGKRADYYKAGPATGYHSRPNSDPLPMSQLTSTLASQPPPPRYHPLPNFLPHFVQSYPINYANTVLVPVFRVIMTAPTIYHTTPFPMTQILPLSQSAGQCFSVSRSTTRYNSENFIKQGIYESISHDCNSLLPTRSNINPRSFIFELQQNETSLLISAETHLNWLVEFSYLFFRSACHENLVDYFDYIKEFHLKREIDHNPDLKYCIDNAIVKLVQSQCILPEIISQLVEMVGPSMSPERACFHYMTLKMSILSNELILSKVGFSRYLEVLESFLEFIPHLPFHIISLNKYEAGFGNLRIALHFASLYEILLGFKDRSSTEVFSAIHNMSHYSDGSLIINFSFEMFQVLDCILKRVFLRMVHLNEEQMDTIFTRFEAVAYDFMRSFSPEHLLMFINRQMNSLLDYYIYFMSMDKELDMGFVEYVSISYHNIPGDKNLKLSMHQIAIYLAYYEMTLKQFRDEYKQGILDCGVDEDFVLVLETIIAATEEIEMETANYEFWEPSIEFLTLQSQIITSKKDENYSIINSPFLMLAAKIFLSRQIGFPISIFSTSTSFTDGFSWKDALDFVNFNVDQNFIGSSHLFKVKSQFFKDLLDEFGDSPNLEQMIFSHKLGQYDNWKRLTII